MTLVDLDVARVWIKYLGTLGIPHWDAKVIFDAYQTALIEDINLDGQPWDTHKKLFSTVGFIGSLLIQAIQLIQSVARLKLDKEVSFLSGFAENLAKLKELWSKIFAC